ncbi:MAG: class I SAM-dependent methyltransferase [Candidatus Sulfotelmatobacter sp.]
MRLYVDYRSPAYNRQRIQWEPEYAAIAAAVGSDPLEVRTRTAALTAFLSKELRTSDPITLLDYGGSDGRFIPDIPGSKFVYEISNIDPVPGVTRIKSESELGTYSLVLLAHVTEHVPNPLNLVRKLSGYVEGGGYLYIETPQEISDQQRDELRNGARRFDIPIHEHINSYCVPAVAALLEAAGFTIVALESASVDLGWVKGIHLRALGRKRLAA